MNTISKVLIMSGLFFLSSCKKEEDKDDNNNDNTALQAAVMGNWDQTLMEEKNGKYVMDGMTYLTFNGKSINDQSTWVFTANPNTVVVNGSYDFVMNYTAGGASQSDTSTTAYTTNSSYVISQGNKISITNVLSGETTDYEVLSFTNNKLELMTHSSFSDSTGGVVLTSSADVYYTLEK